MTGKRFIGREMSSELLIPGTFLPEVWVSDRETGCHDVSDGATERTIVSE